MSRRTSSIGGSSLHHQRSHERLQLDMDLEQTQPPSIAGPSSARSAGPSSAGMAHGHGHGHGHQHPHQHTHAHSHPGHESQLSSPMDVVSSSHAPGSNGGQPAGVGAPQDQPMDEEPLYVNAKQYYRILKRRVARARLEELHRLSRQRKVSSTYDRLSPTSLLHPSLHREFSRMPLSNVTGADMGLTLPLRCGSFFV